MTLRRERLGPGTGQSSSLRKLTDMQTGMESSEFLKSSSGEYRITLPRVPEKTLATQPQDFAIARHKSLLLHISFHRDATASEYGQRSAWFVLLGGGL